MRKGGGIAALALSQSVRDAHAQAAGEAAEASLRAEARRTTTLRQPTRCASETTMSRSPRTIPIDFTKASIHWLFWCFLSFMFLFLFSLQYS